MDKAPASPRGLRARLREEKARVSRKGTVENNLKERALEKVEASERRRARAPASASTRILSLDESLAEAFIGARVAMLEANDER